MPETLKTRSSSIDLGATVVVKREGDLQGQKGSVVDRKQGWYRVQLAGTDGVKSFRWAELKEIEAPASPFRPSATQSQPTSRSSSPLKAITPSESPAEVLAPVAEEAVVATGGSSSTQPSAGGLPPRHPSSTVPTVVAEDEESTMATRRSTRGHSSIGDGGDSVTPSAESSSRGKEPGRPGAVETQGESGQEAADDELTETEEDIAEDHIGAEQEDTDLEEVDEEGGGGNTGDVEQAGEEQKEAQDHKQQEEEEGGQSDDDMGEDGEEEEEEDEEEDIDAMIKLAAAAARKHHTSALASSSSVGGSGSASSGAAAGHAKRPSTSEAGADRALAAARKRPRVTGVAPRALDSGLASPKYLNYGGTAKKGVSLTASVSSGVVDGGKAAKLMAGSALYSGRDRAMLLERSKAPKDDTAGKGWYNMEQAEMTPELKRDLQVIRMRNYVDPKRFYKASDKVSKFMQIGTVKEGPGEYFSSRLTNKERKKTLVDELLVADDAFRAYSKNQYGSIQSRKRAGGKAAYNEQKRKRTGGAKWKP